MHFHKQRIFLTPTFRITEIMSMFGLLKHWCEPSYKLVIFIEEFKQSKNWIWPVFVLILGKKKKEA
jgi:hypothetical protein